LLALVVPGCHGDPGWSGQLTPASAALFQSAAYPVLMRDCAFSECHGAPNRYLQIFGPGRTRLDPLTKTDEPPTPAELEASYARAVSLLATEGRADVTQSPLLRKPLEARAGGVAHRGVDDYGRNVFKDQSDPDYMTLLDWALTLATPSSGALGQNAGSAP
jgi:hypothetical protein